MELTRLRGFRDLIGADARAMSLVEERARAIFDRYSIKEIRIPVLERTQLYSRSSGETSDVVEKQMYTFTDRDEGETAVALRPEGTPGVVRAYVEAGLDRTDPEQRLFYSGPMFRRERPQKGRYRQFYQFGVEIFGRPDAASDAELLIMIDELCRDLKLPFTMEVNSIGDQKCRPAFREALVQWGRAHWDELDDDCHNRIDRNPLRLLDCKRDAKVTESAPKSLDYLCDECRAHFDTVKELVTAANVQYVVNPRMVRGLDYYTRTAFEVMAGGLGAQSTVVAGGRYDGLVETMGGAAVAGIGFAIGVDRMALAVEAAGKTQPKKPAVVIVPLGKTMTPQANVVAQEFRSAGLDTELFSPERKLKALLGRASKIGTEFVVIIGEDENARGVVQLRDLKQSGQQAVTVQEAIESVKNSPNK
ncbi:MAG: histidine--tRNA ligase [Candidatus Binatus sp.]|uniref:histidine--tRNA ligase n=1 Tax=Candidatus Binatus sp. TaxID=2811406 RepID=UPI003C7403FB